MERRRRCRTFYRLRERGGEGGRGSNAREGERGRGIRRTEEDGRRGTGEGGGRLRLGQSDNGASKNK